MQDYALRQFERWMQMVWDLNEGRLQKLGPQSEQWMNGQVFLANEYEKQYAFTKTAFSPAVAGRWFSLFHQPVYLDATRIANNFSVITPPLRVWKYFVDKEKTGEAQELFKPEYSDADWKTTDIGVERWATLGIPDYFGPMWYRQNINVPAIPVGKKVYLWVSREDGDVKVWVNGQAIPYVNAKGETSGEFKNGYGTPVSFDITSAIQPGAQNQITIRGTRVFINELGTGGLLGPAYLYRER
jgi:hypothetical protein